MLTPYNYECYMTQVWEVLVANYGNENKLLRSYYFPKVLDCTDGSAKCFRDGDGCLSITPYLDLPEVVIYPSTKVRVFPFLQGRSWIGNR